MNFRKKLVTIFTATTLATVGAFSSFCLAANSVEGAGQKMITGVKDDTGSEVKKYETQGNASKDVKVDEEKIKEELIKSRDEIVKEFEKFEKSAPKNNNAGSSSDVKCIIVDDEQIKKEIEKSKMQR